MNTYATVLGIARHGTKILFLKRTSSRHSSPGKWQPVSGFLKEKESEEDAVLREVKEETGQTGKILKKGKVFEVNDKWGRWVIIPFLIELKSKKVNIAAEEHSEYKWIRPKEILKLDCVAGVKKDLESVGLY